MYSKKNIWRTLKTLNHQKKKVKLKQIKSIVNINPKLNMWYQTTPPLKDEHEEKLIHTPTKDLPINS